jgi:hypothetical protein
MLEYCIVVSTYFTVGGQIYNMYQVDSQAELTSAREHRLLYCMDALDEDLLAPTTLHTCSTCLPDPASDFLAKSELDWMERGNRWEGREDKNAGCKSE